VPNHNRLANRIVIRTEPREGTAIDGFVKLDGFSIAVAGVISTLEGAAINHDLSAGIQLKMVPLVVVDDQRIVKPDKVTMTESDNRAVTRPIKAVPSTAIDRDALSSVVITCNAVGLIPEHVVERTRTLKRTAVSENRGPARHFQSIRKDVSTRSN